MIEDISGVTSKVVMTALDGLLLKHRVISHNIANASTPNYSAKNVSFENLLSSMTMEASSYAQKNTLTVAMEEIRNLIQGENTLITSTGSKVELDKEMIQLTENVLKYQALLEANSRRGDLLSMAVKGRGN